MSATILHGDCVEMLRTLPAASVHCCVTSPPYWGLRDYGHAGQIGLEETPEAYVARMVEVFREAWRVLRDDGTLWLNLGDSYANQKSGDTYSGFNDRYFGRKTDGGKQAKTVSSANVGRLAFPGLKPKDLVGIPWRVAFALQADGWWLRQDIIWHKPNPMPESVRDRCTKAHEYVFLLTKSDRYFYDAEAVSELSAEMARPQSEKRRLQRMNRGVVVAGGLGQTSKGVDAGAEVTHVMKSGERRNRRSVWTVATKPYKGAHFATMPPHLAELCILAGTSADGCCAECGAPRERVVERERVATRPGADTKITGDTLTDGNRDPQRHVTTSKTTGWKPTCQHNAPTVPCTVLDPFGGSGTTLAVAAEHGRDGVACELNADYIKLAEERIAKAKAKAPLFA